MHDIICIGSASQDIFFPMGDIEMLETPDDLTSQQKMVFELGAKYRIDDRFGAPGGGAVNVSQGLARLGIKSANYSKLGQDNMGTYVLEELEKEGVSTDLVEREKCKTDLAFILVDMASGDRTIFFNRDANERLKVESEKMAQADAFFLSGLYGNWEENLTTIMNHVKDHGASLFYNPGQRNIHKRPDMIIDVIRTCKGLFVNKDEAIELVVHLNQSEHDTHLNDEKYLMEALQGLGLEFVALTDGKRGAWVTDGATITYAKPEIVENPKDSTGAGDAFTSAFLAAYLQEEKDLQQCLRWGVVNSRSVVLHYGAKEGLLDRSAIVDEASKVHIETHQ